MFKREREKFCHEIYIPRWYFRGWITSPGSETAAGWRETAREESVSRGSKDDSLGHTKRKPKLLSVGLKGSSFRQTPVDPKIRNRWEEERLKQRAAMVNGRTCGGWNESRDPLIAWLSRCRQTSTSPGETQPPCFNTSCKFWGKRPRSPSRPLQYRPLEFILLLEQIAIRFVYPL